MSTDNYFDDQSDEQPIVTVEAEQVAEIKVQNAQLRQSYIGETHEPGKVSYRFSIPPLDRPALNAVLHKYNNHPGVIAKADTKEFKDWKRVVEESTDTYTPNDLYLDRFQDPDAMWLQGVEKPDGSLLGINKPRFKQTENAELKGEMAVLQFSKKLGIGDVLTIPLPHSGICVTIKPPMERDLIDFYSSIFREKIFLGRMSAGLTLTNMSVYINNRLFDFIVKHVHSVNYGDIPKEKLRDYLLIHDYHILAWGFAATMYPNGFDYQRACVDDIEKCNHVERETINLLKLLWVDNPSLTQAQKDILFETRPNKLTLDSYRKFITEHSKVKSASHTLKNGMTFFLRVPTFSEHVVDGLGWTNKINTAVDSLIVSDPDEEEKAKQELLQQYVSASLLRQFSHWVDYIEDDESNVVKDRDTINSLLEVFSSDDDLRGELNAAIMKFMANTTIALVGIPSYECANCKKEQNTDPVNERFVSVIPLDVMQLFFTLLTLRISKILERA